MIKDILTTLIQSLASVSILFILTRIMGKKQLSQLTFFDYVVGISIGSITASFAVDAQIGYVKGITGLIVFASFPIVLSFITQKNYKAQKILDGKPTVLIDKGVLIESSIRKEKLTVNEVLQFCRLKNAFDIASVESAVLETNGQVSVQLKSTEKPLTPKDMNIPVPNKGLCLNVILDGEVLDDHLQMAGIERQRIDEELKTQNITDPGVVLLAYIDSGNRLIVHKKNTSEPLNPLV